jgi:RNA polymerase sigma factor (sigma-70 family)
VAVDAARGRAEPLTPTAEPAAAERAGDLYSRFNERIYGYCLYQLGSPEEAEDALQTTFLYAFRALRRGVVPVAEGPWLFTIARNACHERRRGAQRRRSEVLSDPQVLEQGAAAADRNGDDGLRLQQALARVPEQQRVAFVLREWRGLSYREIATELEVSVSAVETLIFRARKTLTQLLSEGDEPRRQRRRVARALDLGSLGAALKSLLGGAAGAKIAAAAAVVSSVIVAGALAPAAGKPPAADPASPRSSAAEAVAPSHRADRAEHADLTAAAAASAVSEPRTGQSSPTPQAPPAGGEAANASTDGEADPPTPAAVDDVVESVERLGSGAGLDVPEVEVVDLPLPVELPALPEPPPLPPVPDLTTVLP